MNLDKLGANTLSHIVDLVNLDYLREFDLVTPSDCDTWLTMIRNTNAFITSSKGWRNSFFSEWDVDAKGGNQIPQYRLSGKLVAQSHSHWLCVTLYEYDSIAHRWNAVGEHLIEVDLHRLSRNVTAVHQVLRYIAIAGTVSNHPLVNNNNVDDAMINEITGNIYKAGLDCPTIITSIA